MTTAPRLAALALLLALAPAAAHAQHEVKLDRAFQAGFKFAVNVQTKLDGGATVEVGGQQVPTPAKKQTLDFTADAVVDEVFDDGRPKKVTYTITSAKGTDNGVERAFLREGQKIVASTGEGGGDQVFTDENGQRVNEELKGLLSMAIGVAGDPEESEDKMLGTDQPQAVGGKWPVNAEEIKADLQREGADLTTAKVDGESELLAANAGVLRIKTVINVSGIVPQGGQIPPTAKIEQTSIRMTNEADYPGDRSKPVTNAVRTFDMSMKMNMAGPDGQQQVNMAVKVDGEAKVTRTAK